MKRFSLMAKLLLVFLIAGTFMFVLLNTLGVHLMKEQMLEKKKEDLYGTATEYVSDYLMGYYSKRDTTYGDLIYQFGLLEDLSGNRAWLVNNNGTIVMDSGTVGVGFALTKAEPEFLEQTFRENVYIKELMSEPMLCVAVPIIHDFTNKGHIVLSVPMSRIEAEGVYYIDFVNICYLLFLPIFFLLFLLIYHMTGRPVAKMAESAKKFLRGNFKEPLELNYSEEYQELGHTIQFMGDKLKNNDEIQRKFVSNVSHDFRSPLTSIKGYIEAIKDGTIPPELQEKYLDIVIFETEPIMSNS